MDIWGEEHFISEQAPAALKQRISAEIRSMAAQAWLGLHPVAKHRRVAMQAAAATPMEVYRALVEADGNSRPQTAPYLIVKVLERPRDLDLVRRNRGSEHQQCLDVKQHSRLGLILEDWFYLPASSPGSATPDILQPQFVAASPRSADADRWLVEVGYFFVFEDGWTLRPDCIDIAPGMVSHRGQLVPWEGAATP